MFTARTADTGRPAVIAFRKKSDAASFLLLLRQASTPSAPAGTCNGGAAAAAAAGVQLLPRPQAPVTVECVPLQELLATACSMGGLNVCMYGRGVGGLTVYQPIQRA